MNSRLVGIILTVVGLGIALIAGIWLATQVAARNEAIARGVQNFTEQDGLDASGIAIGAGLAFIPVALFVGAGLYLFVRGGTEAQEESVMQKQRQLLDILKSRGQVSVNDMALEMHTNVDSVKDMVYQLVGLQVFSGYVNWENGVLYSSEAKELRALDKCKNCGGEISLVGKGVVRCKYCGTEYFLS